MKVRKPRNPIVWCPACACETGIEILGEFSAIHEVQLDDPGGRPYHWEISTLKSHFPWPSRLQLRCKKGGHIIKPKGSRRDWGDGIQTADHIRELKAEREKRARSRIRNAIQEETPQENPT